MWFRLLFILPIILSAHAIKVAVENDENVDRADVLTSRPKKPIYYEADDAEVDSYLIPPDTRNTPEEGSDIIATPATYLVPPLPDKQTDYFAPTEPGQQSDWYPIAVPQKPENPLPLFQTPNRTEAFAVNNVRKGKSSQEFQNKPSIHLEPPAVSAPDDYVMSYDEVVDEANPSTNFEVPRLAPGKIPFRFKQEPGLPLHLTPPEPEVPLYKIPTKLYPKKVTGGFKPVPIPIAQFADDILQPPRARPAQPFKPLPVTDFDHAAILADKTSYLQKQAEEKRKDKKRAESQEYISDQPSIDGSYEPAPAEQQTSETNYGRPGRNSYSAPIRQKSPEALQRDPTGAPAPDERTEFRMHGLKGPHSYQFGYDTGKGKNRQFRYEERDNDGEIHGHYGYMDKHGKMRIVNYSAHPERGFHAEPPVEKL